MADPVKYLLTLPQGLLDYVFFSILLFFICLLIMALINVVSGGVFSVLFFAAFILTPIYYFNHIGYGNYMAINLEINDKNVGEGTNENKPFSFNFENNRVILTDGYTDFNIKRYSPDFYYLDTQKSNIYTKVYKNNTTKDVLKISLLGYTKVYNEKNKKLLDIEIKN